MSIQREWVTPLAAGAFLLSAVTGVLIFFHIDTGLNKPAHEWLSWVLLMGVGLHVAANFGGLKRHLATSRGKALIGLFVVVLALSFYSPGGFKDEPPFVAPMRALANAPLTTVAQVANISPDELLQRLRNAGLQPGSAQQKLSDLTGPNPRRQTDVLGKVFGAANGAPSASGQSGTNK